MVKAEGRPFQSSETETSDLHQMRATWHSICVSHDDYIDYLIAHTLEVIELYKPDGIFQDILLPWECVCQKCLTRMKRDGLDANKKEDRLKNHRNAIMDYYKKMSEAVWKKDPEMRLFHNSGHIYKNERERWKYFSHLELESLPTGGWGYDHFPISARYANTLGIDYLGMTGKFHTTWGEFGGFKKSAALEYECLLMVAMGARCSVGDQLHPSGEMEMATYDSIGPGYGRVKEIEAFLPGARPVSEIAILSAEGRHRQRSKESSDIGSARMLLEEQLMFDVIDEESDFEIYKCLVFPDLITLEGKLLEKTKAFLKKGGKLILSGSSGFSPDEKGFAIDFKAEVKGMSEFSPDYLVGDKKLDAELPEAPFVMYEKAWRVKSKGAEVLAETKVPYFNRTWEHFSSHQHAPFRPEKNGDYDGILRDGNVIYFS
ncbi:MAG: beta-galactosidase trimerization domain-containing protein, partial [Spirochaetia bacterium]|nr:beta-galactosidase trimerization domain-containing protein [Spirochaetia bacterium]